MPRTELRGAQIRDTEIGRADINVATPGQAIVAKIVAGSGISISSTGADTGTGDVTITASGGGGTPGGATTQVQFNDAGVFGGNANFTFNKTTPAITLLGDLILKSTSKALLNTVDGTDNGWWALCGGGAATVARGGFIELYGNESVSPGNINFNPGMGVGAKIRFSLLNGTEVVIRNQGGTDIFSVNNDSGLTFISGFSATTPVATASARGLLPTLSGVAAQFLNGTGAWATPSGGGGATIYTHTQSTAATTWTITHNLNAVGYAVTITNTAGGKLIPDTLVYTSVNVITVTFAIAQAGFAYVSGGGAQGPIGPPGNVTLPLTVDLTFDTADGIIRQTTADGADTKAITIMGGGAVGPTRGATMYIEGNESSWNPGSFITVLGEASGSKFTVVDSAWNQRMSVESWGCWFAGSQTVGGYITFNRNDGLVLTNTNAGYVAVGGGTGIDAATQGASVLVAGNTHGTLAGRVRIQMGSVAGAALEVMNSGFQNMFNVDAASGTVAVSNRITVTPAVSVIGVTVTKPLGSASTSPGVRVQAYSPSIELMDKDSVQNWYMGINDNDSDSLYFGRGYGPNQGMPAAIKITTADVVELPEGKLKFPATQKPSADPYTMDDFREHLDWTPVVVGLGGGTCTHGNQFGRYQKIGKWVNAFCYVSLTSKGTLSGSIEISGLPFPGSSGGLAYMIGSILYQDLATNVGDMCCYSLPGSTNIRLTYSAAGGGPSNNYMLQNTQLLNTTSFLVNIRYEAAN